MLYVFSCSLIQWKPNLFHTVCALLIIREHMVWQLLNQDMPQDALKLIEISVSVFFMNRFAYLFI